MIEDKRDEGRIAKRIGHIIRWWCGCLRPPRRGSIDQPERADLPRDAVFNDGELRTLHVTHRMPATVAHDDVEDDGRGAGPELRARRRGGVLRTRRCERQKRQKSGRGARTTRRREGTQGPEHG